METPEDVLQEARLVRRFVAGESELYQWFRAQLETQQRGLIRLLGRLDLTPDARAVLNGKLSLISDLIVAPERLLTITEREEKAVEAYVRPHAPIGAPSPF